MVCDNNFGSILYKLRKELGITQNDLANALNISNKTVSKWEVGITTPSFEMLYKISEYFKVPFSDLISSVVAYNDNDTFITKEIIKEFSNTKKKRFNLLKIVGVIISFLRLILKIIELVFKVEC